MSASRKDFSLRSLRGGDEAAIARLFNAYAADFVGPQAVTARSWRAQYARQSWTGPSVEKDRDCVRIAERAGRVVGYAVTDYQPEWTRNAAAVQELCVADHECAGAVARALLKDAEERALARGKHCLILHLSPQDGRACRLAAESGFEMPTAGGQVFMAAVTDLTRFLDEIRQELTRRLGESEFRGWQGVVRLRSGTQEAALRLKQSQVRTVAAPDKAEISVTIAPEVLPLLLFGQMPVREAYLQDCLSVQAADGAEALRLLAALFPTRPIHLPRAQWW